MAFADSFFRPTIPMVAPSKWPLVTDAITKILLLLEKSIRTAFAVAIAGLVAMVLLPSAFNLLIIPTLLALGFIAVQLCIWIWSAASWLKHRAQRAWQYWDVLKRVDALVPRTRLALLWIANNPKEPVHGSPFVDPFRELLAQGFIFRTDMETLFSQAYRVHPRVYSSRDKSGIRRCLGGVSRVV